MPLLLMLMALGMAYGGADQDSVIYWDGTNLIVDPTQVSAGDVQLEGDLNMNSNQVDNVSQLNVDNLRLDGNTISSTDTNGNIILSPDGTGDIHPDADDAVDVGSSSLRFSEVFGTRPTFVGGGATITNNGTFNANFGYAGGAGTVTFVNDPAYGSFNCIAASVYAASGCTGIIEAYAGGNFVTGRIGAYFSSTCGIEMSYTTYGSFAAGYIWNNSTGMCKMRIISPGSFTQGYLNSLAGKAYMDNYGNGAFNQGIIAAANGYCVMGANGRGSFVQGSINVTTTGYGYITSSNEGSFSQGAINNAGSGYSFIRSTANGAMAQGYSRAAGTATSNIQGSGQGSLAQGFARASGAYTATILASGVGSTALGRTRAGTSNADITASGTGSLAVGNASNDTVAATDDNTFQFGIGTNSVTNSLQVGDRGSTTNAYGGIQFRGGQVIMNAETELTIATGSITPNRSRHTVDTESDAATDDLDTIVALTDGTLLIISAADSARTVVAKDGTGNLNLAGDFSLDNVEDKLMLVCDGTDWHELSRSDNGA